jgi:Zn-dependent M28 family amino/carboxypeptidase
MRGSGDDLDGGKGCAAGRPARVYYSGSMTVTFPGNQGKSGAVLEWTAITGFETTTGALERRTYKRGRYDDRMITTLLMLAVCSVPAPVQAHADEEPRPMLAIEDYEATVASIVREALVNGRAYALLEELCTLAPHRLAGSKGAARAVEWAETTMKELGLENVRREACTVPFWERGTVESLVVAAPSSKRSMPLPILALGGSVGTPDEGISAEVIEVTSFEDLRALGEAVRGKFVFFNRPMDPSLAPFRAYGGAVNQRSRGAIETAKLGGVGAIVRSMTMRIDDSPHTGMMNYAEGVTRVPSVAISTLGAERLSKLLKSGSATVTLKLDCQTHEDEPSANVIGELIGSELPEEVIVVGGHLDAWDVGQGAHDDGAGCVHALEAVRLIKALGLKPRRTLRVVMFMNEENGMRGAHAYRDTHEDALGKHVLALESDRGGYTPRGFTTNASPDILARLQRIGALLEPYGAGRVIPGGGGVDIGPLGPHGVPLVGYLPDDQRYFDLHHSERDTLAEVHPRELQLGAGVIAALLYVVADLGEPWSRNPSSR